VTSRLPRFAGNLHSPCLGRFNSNHLYSVEGADAVVKSSVSRPECRLGILSVIRIDSMNWLEFVASLARSLAWPAAVVALVVWLRDPITRTLFTLTRLRYKDLELDFGRELNRLKQEAKAVDITPQPAKSIAAAKKDSSQLLEEAARLAQDFPGPAVAVGWQAVEDELMSAVMRLAISPDYPPHNSAFKNADLLKQQNAIDQGTFVLLSRMRNLRNMAVHGGHGASPVTTDDAIEFLDLARAVVGKLQTLRRG
jgi:hypothetical protein